MSIDSSKHEILAKGLLPVPQHLIGGDWSTSATGGSRPHVNPSTGDVQATIPMSGASEVDDAVAAAKRAAGPWRDLPPHERQSLLAAMGRVVEKNSTQLGTILSLETGLPVSLTESFSLRGADYLYYNASVAATMQGQVIQVDPVRSLDYVLPEPYGVVALIMTWNGGMSALGRKAGAALAAGNTVVIKPSELAPFSTVRFAEFAIEAGFPPGVINVVHGDAAAGDRLVRASDVRKVSFTGGVAAARKIQASAAIAPKPVALELGGKSANIIFPDADIEAAARSAAVGALYMSGQGCALPTRLLVHADIYEDVVDRVRDAAAVLAVGDPLDPDTVMGPIITEGHLERLLAVVDKAVQAKDGELTMGGGRVDELRPGCFMEATILERVDPQSQVATEEHFGPILSVFPFSDDDEAVHLANDTEYGLTAYVHTHSLERAHDMARRLEAGSISINGFRGGSNRGGAGTPFGGKKASGFGREGGKAGVEEFVSTKNVFLGW
jgi:aldehyde dehydrogenase (NAD+)